MALFKLTIYDICTDAEPTDTSTILTKSLLTDMQLVELNGYQYALVGLNMTKQMYQPTEIIADIHIQTIEGKTWADINRKTIEIMFKHRKVSLTSVVYENKEPKDDDTIGSDFYVHEVMPEYMADCMSLRLKIYSLDKMLTLKKTSRSYVGKKLASDILTKELAKYKLPYDSDKTLGYNADNMHVLYFTNNDDKKVEHMFPYLVQYNESFYDMLARTTNRWGEFLYYEDGSLRIGYDDDETKIKTVSNDYYKKTYSTQNADEDLLKEVTDGNYEMEAAYDKTVYDTPVPKNPYVTRGEFLKPGGLGDKWFMKKLASFLNTEKNIPSWIANSLIDDLTSTVQALTNTATWNAAVNAHYFDDKGTDEQYGKYTFKLFSRPFGIPDQEKEKDGFNEFTEITSAYANEDEIYDAKRYGKIRTLEEDAANNVVTINYDTTWPALKLGDIIKVDGERFIVFNISAVYDNEILTFEVKGSGANEYTDSNDKTVYEYYPAMIPSGHVRYSGPQIATIIDANDPTLFHRVRLAFPWQGDVTDAADASPWVPFAGKNDGKATTSRHYSGDEVFVGFVDGNIERPYVIGNRQKNKPDDVTIDVNIDTPGGHHMRMSDGEGLGLLKSTLSSISPVADTIMQFVSPALIGEAVDIDWTFSKHFEGGFQISDYYGFYKISGSSSDRNVTISSPWGDVKINAFTGISISAPNGDVEIKGKNVKIEAGNNLELVSGTNIGKKLFSDKKFGDLSAASFGLSLASTVANNLAQKVQLLDLSIVRSLVEVVMRPVEGALTVRSNRFLKLEAGGNECEYPKFAYDTEKKKKMLEAAAQASFITNTCVASEGLIELFKITSSITDAVISKWHKLYGECQSKKAAFEKATKELSKYANDGDAVCNTYAELKNDLWNKDKEDITVDDLGFKDNVAVEGEVNNIVNAGVLTHFMFKNREDIVTLRTKARASVLDAAIALHTACLALVNFDVTQDDVDKAFGHFRTTTLPEDSKTKMFEALTEQNCKNFRMYNVDDNVKNLTDQYKGLKEEISKKFRRLLCLNLLKKFDLTRNRTKENGIAPLEPTAATILNETTWTKYVNSLSEVPVIDMEDSNVLVETIKDAFTQQFSDLKDDLNFPKWKDEMQAWSDGKKGSVLIGYNNKTYRLDDRFGIATFDKIERITGILTDKNHKKINKYMANIKETLRSI